MQNVRKAAQVAAFFISRSAFPQGRMKLIKLMYLADREALSEYGFPITDDEPYSLAKGPILSHSLNLLRGISTDAQWSEWVTARDGYTLARDVRSVDDFDELSEAEIDVLNRTWNKFGTWTGEKLSTYTHDHCREWENPKGSSSKISHSSIFNAIGIDAEKSIEQEKTIVEDRALSQTLKTLS